MKLYRLDYYCEDVGELIGFFTSLDAAMQYSLHDREVDVVTSRTWSEVCEFSYSGGAKLEEKMDGMISTEKGLQAWEHGANLKSFYYQ